MLNDKDFAIIRAALQFLDDEFTRTDDNLLNHYLDERGLRSGAKAADIKITRAKLKHAIVYLGLKRVGEPVMMTTEIFPANAELPYQEGDAVPVSIVDAGE